MNMVSQNEPVYRALKEGLQARLAGCGAEVLEIRRAIDRGDIEALVRWGPFEVRAAADERFSMARGGKDAARDLLFVLEKNVGVSIENAIGDFAQRRVDKIVIDLRADVVKAMSAQNRHLELAAANLREEIAELRRLVLADRRPWYQKFWNWLTTYRRGQ